MTKTPSPVEALEAILAAWEADDISLNRTLVAMIRDALNNTQGSREADFPAAPQIEAQPVPMLLFCPRCSVQHIDSSDADHPGMLHPSWDNPPHRSHLCHACGCVWRPSDVATTGVAEIATKGKADNWLSRIEAQGSEPVCVTCGAVNADPRPWDRREPRCPACQDGRAPPPLGVWPDREADIRALLADLEKLGMEGRSHEVQAEGRRHLATVQRLLALPSSPWRPISEAPQDTALRIVAPGGGGYDWAVAQWGTDRLRGDKADREGWWFGGIWMDPQPTLFLDIPPLPSPPSSIGGA